jgi:hypothetical protein
VGPQGVPGVGYPSEWQPGAGYEAGSVVTYNGAVYRLVGASEPDDGYPVGV